MAEAGIAGRGVLLDYWAYAQRHGIHYDPQDTHPITLADLEACRAEQGTELRAGDILLIRSGAYIRVLSKPDSRHNCTQASHPISSRVCVAVVETL